MDLDIPRFRAGQVVLVTGPTRSGKSDWAERLAAQAIAPTITYIATARPMPEDAEWCDRIEQHCQRRPATWGLKEVPEALAETLATANSEDCLLIDSLGTWVANGLEMAETDWQARSQSLGEALRSCPALVILVAEETGWGVVPAYALGRRFRDRLGQLTRRLAQQADAVYLTTAGYAIPLHQMGYPLDAE